MYFEIREPPCKSDAPPQVNRLTRYQDAIRQPSRRFSVRSNVGLGLTRIYCHKPGMTISIRPHHLLCMLTYLGKGYTPQFVVNYDKIVERINSGEAINIVNGPDDICKPMLPEADCHCHNENVLGRDAHALSQIVPVIGEDVRAGHILHLSPERISKLRSRFRKGTLRAACSGCQWQEFCTSIAENNFRHCRLTGAASSKKNKSSDDA